MVKRKSNLLSDAQMRKMERGLHSFYVWQAVFKDRVRYMLPVLYIINGEGADAIATPLHPLVEYCVDNAALSSQWLLNTVRSVGLLIDYGVAWQPYINSYKSRKQSDEVHERLLAGFVRALLNGTSVIEKGQRRETMGLFWPPRTEENVKKIVSAVTSFLKTLDKNSAWRLAATAKSTDALAAVKIAHQYLIEQQKSLLAHIKGTRISMVAPHPYGGQFGHRKSSTDTYRFPAKYVIRFLLEAFTAQSGTQTNETAQLIAFLLFAGGCRYSELFHVWVQDVQLINDDLLVFLHEPSDSKVIDARGKGVTRSIELGKVGRIPRNKLRKRGHAGFKGRNGSLLIWLPLPGLTEMLKRRLTHYLTVTRPRIMRERRGAGLADHNYLFVKTGDVRPGHTSVVGDPYDLTAFREAWERAINRLRKLTEDPDLILKKENGTTIHAARHFYGTFLRSIGIDGLTIMECMGHRSPHSQYRYTSFSADEINAILEEKSGAIAELKTSFGDTFSALRNQPRHFWSAPTRFA